MKKQRIVIKNMDKNTKRYKLLSGLTHISIKNRRYRADIIEGLLSGGLKEEI